MRQFRRSPSQRPPARIVRVESREARSMGESRARTILVACFFGLCFIMLSLRLLEVSTMGGGDLPFKRLVTEPQLLLTREDDVDVSKVAEEEQVVRREIVDRNGLVLATSIKTASLVANPTIIRHEHEVAEGLSKIFTKESTAEFEEKLMKKHVTFMYLERHLTPKQQEAVNNLGVPGLFFEPDIRRVYPYGGLFSHTIGYVDTDNNGIAGIEKSFDDSLQNASIDGPLQLSLDLRIQSMLRDELSKAVDQFRAIGGIGIVLDIQSGEILAMTSLPEFDPHQPGKASDDQRFNRATLGDYEMGSTFKTFTLAASIENKVVTMQSGYDASHPIHMDGFTINDAEPMGRWLSVPEIFAYSSNIGAAKMALDLGGKRQRAFLKALGLFEPVKLEVPELAHPLVPHDWSELTTMTVAYGHGMAVTPLHLINAIAGLASDGCLHPMTLLKDGNKNKAHDGPQIISPSTIADVRDLLRLVVVHGTGKSANAPGYDVGGKTGTAEKNTNGVYKKDAKVASFVSVFPVTNPKYAILVMVDEPKGDKSTYGFATGGWISAPVVGRVVQRMAPLLAMSPDFTPPDDHVNSYWANSESRATAAKLAHENKQTQEAVHAATF